MIYIFLTFFYNVLIHCTLKCIGSNKKVVFFITLTNATRTEGEENDAVCAATRLELEFTQQLVNMLPDEV